MYLTASQVRILGCLMEKQVTTPDLYPLTVNSLKAASNQTTNRYPVMELSEGSITTDLITLREMKLTRTVYSPSNRAPKHKHTMDEALHLEMPEQAVMTILALRGAQTVGEIKSRTERIHPFGDLAAVERSLDDLANRTDPLVIRLSRRPGQKEDRYTHLLCGPVDEAALAAEEDNAPTSVRADRVSELQGRVDQLEGRIAELEQVVERLRAVLD